MTTTTPLKRNYDSNNWNNGAIIVFKQDMNDAYEWILHWWQSLFILPNGASEKKNILLITCLLKIWIHVSLLKTVAMHVVPALLFPKPSKMSKTKDHLTSLVRQIKLREKGNISNLLDEKETIYKMREISKNGIKSG